MEQVSRSSNSPSIQIGEILQSPPDIQVKYNGIVLTKEELWISHYLLAGYGRTARGHLVSATQNRAGGSGDAAYQSHNHDIHNDYTDSVITTDTLKPGMKVAIMPMLVNGKIQQYVILDEIVSWTDMADPFVALASEADTSVRETLPLLSEYGYDFEKHRFRYDENGNNITVTENEALKVWIYKALMTERYRYLAYHDEYGITIEPYQERCLTASIQQTRSARISGRVGRQSYIARINRVDVEKREKDDLSILVDVTSIYSDESITVAAERSLA